MSGASRLLIVNPNTNGAVTRWLSEEAERAAGGAFDIAALNAPSGLAAIETPEHAARAAGTVIATIESDRAAVAAIIGAFGDPGLAEARRDLRIPVIGLGEAGMRAASFGGRRFAIITLGEAMRAPIATRATALGLGDELARIEVLPFSIAEMVADREGRLEAIVETIRMSREPAVLLGGAPFAGLARMVRDQTEAMVLDGVEASVLAARRALDAATI
jgi:allantoin racemase